jgi:hypothetical protein
VRAARPLVALDVSLSWLRASDTTAWARARDQARSAGGDSVLLVGHTLRVGTPPALPTDTTALMVAAADRAQLAGRPLHLYTDGEFTGDAGTLRARLPEGSRFFVEPVERRPDLAITGLEVQPAARVGDTVRARVHLAAGGTPLAPAALLTRIDGTTAARVSLDEFRPWERRAQDITFPLTPGSVRARLEFVVESAMDGEPRNDTASREVRRGERMNAVAASTAPDVDFREIVRVLRGSLALPTSARFRIAPDRWIDDAGLPVTQAQVRNEFAQAQVAVLHGDTGFFGSPRTAARGALALIPPPQDDGEWYLIGPFPGPLAATLATMHFDSLPPVAIGAVGAGVPLLAARGPAQRRQEVGTLEDGARRVVVMPLRGSARWALRGGAAADGFTTLWGTVFAALAERPGEEFASPAPVVPPGELQPRQPVLETGRTGAPVAGAARSPLRSALWPYVLIVALLCAEWLVRRRGGLR